MFSNDEIINAFTQENADILNQIYNECFILVKNLICTNGGTAPEVYDIMQDAFLIILKKIESKNFNLSCSFKTYFYAICKNLLILKNRQEKQLVRKFDSSLICSDLFSSNFEIDEKKITLYSHHLKRISKICQQIFELHFKDISHYEICRKLNIKNNDYLSKRKSLCTHSLKKRIESDPDYKKLLTYEF